jgi:hypothetical protein
MQGIFPNRLGVFVAEKKIELSRGTMQGATTRVLPGVCIAATRFVCDASCLDFERYLPYISNHESTAFYIVADTLREYTSSPRLRSYLQ